MFGLLNNIDTKQLDDLSESFNKTEPNELKLNNEEEINKENGMKSIHHYNLVNNKRASTIDALGDINIEDITNYDVRPEEILKHFGLVFNNNDVDNYRASRRMMSIVSTMKKNNEELKHYHELTKLSPLKKARMLATDID